MPSGYLVPGGFGEIEYVEKRSRFIARVWPAANEEQALARLRETRERHWDASHNVYAYIITNGGIMRYSDDGEPSGTSGMPAGIARMTLLDIVTLVCSYPQYERLRAELPRFGANIEDTQFGVDVELTLSMTPESFERLLPRVTELTAATALCEVTGQELRPVTVEEGHK